uniref:Uncharacterized protein n=1 Tax=Arundo donax TaxID=35708 RepID=A0A0A9CVJ8_ARUDO
MTDVLQIHPLLCLPLMCHLLLMHLRLMCLLLVSHLLQRILLLSFLTIVGRFDFQTGLLPALFFPSRSLTAQLFIIRNVSMRWQRRLLLLSALAHGILFPFLHMFVLLRASGFTGLRPDLMVLSSATRLVL